MIGNVQRNEGYLHDAAAGPEGAPRDRRRRARRRLLLGDRAGQGPGHAGDLHAEECDVLLRDFLSPALFEAGLICRADDRGDPVIQLSPPLICTREHIDEAIAVFDDVLPRAMECMRSLRR